MSGPMECKDFKEAFLAALDALAEGKRSADQTLSSITTIAEQSHETTEQVREIAKLVVEQLKMDDK